ncbi:chaperonin 10-like protein [Crepidotus variabilis]|uniref:Chaperonin 10-like protein n=1 Tax=Crepidotus variabilis TaxID=179855 RepID=A0A9P6JIQ5_9AGAR|nr:chaperonin 10-like protein [Crepidotus variabilis]
MSISQTHKALVAHEIGGALVAIDVPTYSPGQGELLVKAHSVALNPADWKIHRNRVMDHYPVIFGFDMAGEVVQVGEGVEGFSVGDRIFGQTTVTANRRAGFQQYLIKDAATAAKIPEDVSYDEAGTLPLGFATAITGLYAEFPHGAGLTPPFTRDTEGKYTGQPIVVLGGSSSVGQATIQAAQISGFSPIITTASERHSNFLRTLGATHVLSRQLDRSTLRNAIKSIIGDKSIEVVYDAVSLEDTQKLGASLLGKGGVLILVLNSKLTPKESRDVKLAAAYASFTEPWNVVLLRKAFQEKLNGWLKDDRIKPNNYEILPDGLGGISGGLQRMADNQVSAAKLLAHPQETP